MLTNKSTLRSVDTSIVCFFSMLLLSTHYDSECWILIRIVHSACHSLPFLYFSHLYMNVKLIFALCLILITSKIVPSCADLVVIHLVNPLHPQIFGCS